MGGRNREIMVALTVGAVGGFFLFLARSVITSPNDPVGPILVPTIVSVMLIGLAVLHLTIAFLSRGQWTDNGLSVIGKGEAELANLTGKPVFRMAAIIVSGFVYIYLLAATGYLISSAIMFAIVLIVFGNRTLGKVALLSVGGAAAYYLLFIELMGIHIPPGWLIDLSAFGLG